MYKESNLVRPLCKASVIDRRLEVGELDIIIGAKCHGCGNLVFDRSNFGLGEMLRSEIGLDFIGSEDFIDFTPTSLSLS